MKAPARIPEPAASVESTAKKPMFSASEATAPETVTIASAKNQKPSSGLWYQGVGAVNTPGGFHSFEHRWALAQAFQFHRSVGRSRIATRTHALNRRFKRGLAQMRHVRLYTPQSDRVSAGIVCFDVRDFSPETVVDRLRARGIIATATPYSPSYARVSPSILNTPSEVDRALAAIRAM